MSRKTDSASRHCDVSVDGEARDVAERARVPIVAAAVLGSCAGGERAEPDKIETKADDIAAADTNCRQRDERCVTLT